MKFEPRKFFKYLLNSDEYCTRTKKMMQIWKDNSQKYCMVFTLNAPLIKETGKQIYSDVRNVAYALDSSDTKASGTIGIK